MQGDCAEVVDVADSDISALSGEQQENRHGMHAPRVRNKKAHGAHPQNQNASEHNTQHAVRPLRAQQLLEHRNENQRTTSTLPKRDGGGGGNHTYDAPCTVWFNGSADDGNRAATFIKQLHTPCQPTEEPATRNDSTCC